MSSSAVWRVWIGEYSSKYSFETYFKVLYLHRVLKRRMVKLLIAVILLLLFVFACYFKSGEEEL